MTKEEYRQLRKTVGSQMEVARLLGVQVSTVTRRENGIRAVNDEARLALIHVATCRMPVGRKKDPK